MTPIHSGRTRAIRVALPLSRAGIGIGTDILTCDGILPIEYLVPGDRLITRDRGSVVLRGLSLREVPAHETVRVTPAALDPDTTARSFLLSARQTVLVSGWQARAMFAKPAALVEIGRLADGRFIRRGAGDGPTRLFQPVLDGGRHALPLAGGALHAISAKVSGHRTRHEKPTTR